MVHEAAQREVCPRDGTRMEDWVDDEGMPHDPPRFEATTHECPGCAEVARLQIHLRESAKATSGDDSTQAERALAGISVGIVPFDSDRQQPGEG